MRSLKMSQFSIQEIAQHVSGKIIGNEETLITGLEQIEQAQPGQLTFIGSRKYLKLWEHSQASAALVNQDLELNTGNRTLIQVVSADLAIAQLLELFAPDPPQFTAGVHETAVVDSTVVLGKNVSIGAGCYLGPHVKVGDDSLLYANVTVMDESTIGCRSVVWPGVVVRDRCHIGDDCILYQNASIGSDGFGYRPSLDKKTLVKIPQIGEVVIGNCVEVGANSCVDRGKFSSTRIGDGTKIDNLVQIGHNCCIGQSCIIVAAAAIGGSVTLGDFVTVAGEVAISDHVTIGSHATIGGGSIVISNIESHQFVSGFPAAPHKTTLQQWASIKKLPDILKKLNLSKGQKK
jgi:UDP-3-O-[3-hydroxymyristoyl] glucosamine N-acyltransferase